MPSEVELENLVVKLSGDAAEYQKMIQEALTSIKELNQHVEESVKHSEHLSHQLKELGETAAQAFVSEKAFEFLKDIFHAGQEVEELHVRLGAAIKNNGGAVEETMAQYEEFAETMKKTTNTDDDATIKMLAMAEAQGISNEHAETAVKNSIAMTGIKGGEAQSYLRAMMAMEQGNLFMLNRMFPAIRNMVNEEEKLEYVHKRLAGGFETAQALTGTAAGKMKEFHIAVEDVKKELGAVLSDALTPVIAGFSDLVHHFVGMDPATRKIIVSVIALSASLVAIGPIIKAIQFVPTLFTGVSALMAMGGHLASAAKGMFTFSSSIEAAASASKAMSIATAALQVGLVSLAAVGLAYAISQLSGYNAALKESQELNERGAKQVKSSVEERTAKTIEHAEGITDPKARGKFLSGEIETEMKELQGINSKINDAKEDLAVVFSFNAKRTPQADKDIIEQQTPRLEAHREAVKKLREEYEKTKDIELAPKLQKAYDNLINSAKEEAIALGLEGEQKKLAKIISDGLTGAKLAEIKGILAANEATKFETEQTKKEEDARNKLVETINQTKAGFIDEARTIGMSTEAKKIHKLAMEGMDEASQKELLTLAMETEARQHLHKLMDDGKKLNEDFATPQEKLALKMADLQEKLDVGAITFQTYGLAAEAAAKEVEKAAAATEKFDSVSFFSAEGQARMEHLFREQSKMTPLPSQEASRGIYQERRAKELEEKFGGGKEVKPDANTPILQQMLKVLQDEAAIPPVVLTPAPL